MNACPYPQQPGPSRLWFSLQRARMIAGRGTRGSRSVGPRGCHAPRWVNHRRPWGPSTSPACRLAREARRNVAVCAISVNEFKTGLTIEIDKAPWRVVEFLHVKPGKGAAFVRSKLKNVITGNTVEKTFRAGEKVELAQMEKSTKQFTYMDGDQYVFMDMTSYEEIRLEKDDTWAKFLKEGMEAGVLEWEGKVIGVELPRTVSLQVTQTDTGDKGNTKSGGGDKPATLETGHVVTVPLFVQEGENVIVDTVTGKYMSRDKDA
ncbi:elongation factor P [Chloropicon primus]|nr:elongation factor P [Chloropicon primus]